MLPGVFLSKNKKNEQYFRSSVTVFSKHISLGSYKTEEEAHKAYLAARALLADPSCPPGAYAEKEEYNRHLPFEKFICLVNLRDNRVYFPTPIYMMKNFFRYYLEPERYMTFDIDDLFYFARHKIQRRGGRLFTSDYGMQVTLSTRYGIRPYAVCGRDYEFINGDELDYRYENIRILSRYAGVVPIYSDKINTPSQTRGLQYKVKIHFKGNYTVGSYDDEITAAIAYNKAVDLIKSYYPSKKYCQNYIEELPAREYAGLYTQIDIHGFKKSFIRNNPSLHSIHEKG